jgi:UDP-N-acetylmuramoylalanine--D-glutamate ligase
MNAQPTFHRQYSALPLTGKVLVVGLGKTGLSCVRHLQARGWQLALTDSRAKPPGLDQVRESWPDLPVFVGGFDAGVFAAADSLLVSPGVSLQEPLIAAAIRAGKPVIGDIELFAREVKAPVVAITGSNGKSTVTTLVAEMARAANINTAVGGNLGEPALDLLEQHAALYVLELSSFQLESLTSLRPRVAALLNISADHMDRYTDLAGYAAAKSQVFRGAQAAVINADDPLTVDLLPEGLPATRFSLRSAGAGDYGLITVAGRTLLSRGEQPLLPVDEMYMPGRHNWANALAAWAIAAQLGIADELVSKVLRGFVGLPHRTQRVRELRGVRWYNDSKGTNVGATIAALEGLAEGDRKVVLIAGGDCKGADFAPLAPVVGQTARCVILIGRDGPRIAAALGGQVDTLTAMDMAEAVSLAASRARPGDSVLLSPACASFDMYNNYMHRGDVFIAAVDGLPL